MRGKGAPTLAWTTGSLGRPWRGGNGGQKGEPRTRPGLTENAGFTVDATRVAGTDSLIQVLDPIH